jgi:hypothetical protein
MVLPLSGMLGILRLSVVTWKRYLLIGMCTTTCQGRHASHGTGCVIDVIETAVELPMMVKPMDTRRVAMNATDAIVQASVEDTTCPHCHKNTTVVLPENYAPVYVNCLNCGKKFIVERLAHGFDVFTIEGAPRDSDPDCRAIDMSSCDEQ